MNQTGVGEDRWCSPFTLGPPLLNISTRRPCRGISILLSAPLCQSGVQSRPARVPCLPLLLAHTCAVNERTLSVRWQGTAGNLMHVPPRHSCGRLGFSINPHTPLCTHMRHSAQRLEGNLHIVWSWWDEEWFYLRLSDAHKKKTPRWHRLWSLKKYICSSFFF